MARSRRRDQWDHTVNLIATLVNINRDSKKVAAMKAEDIHPFRDEVILTPAEKRLALKDQMATLKARAFKGKSKQIARFIPTNKTRRQQNPQSVGDKG